jgi:hypothetical protein
LSHFLSTLSVGAHDIACEVAGGRLWHKAT